MALEYRTRTRPAVRVGLVSSQLLWGNGVSSNALKQLPPCTLEFVAPACSKQAKSFLHDGVDTSHGIGDYMVNEDPGNEIGGGTVVPVKVARA